VQPAASLPSVAKEHGAAVVEVNIEQAFPGADVCILEKAGKALPQIVNELKERL
jgi:NAD-dependent SIR2 family protein deacetylase